LRYDARMPTDVKPAAATDARPVREGVASIKACPTDLAIQCPTCGTKMQPEHAHYRCLACGYRDSCCM
jgi:hypothetical protein